MALIEVETGSSASLCAAQTGNGDSTNIAVREFDNILPGGAVVIASTIGATPTVTVAILGSIDGVNYWNVPYSLVATPRTFVVANLTITTATTSTYLLQEQVAWRFLKLNLSANTNVTLTATAYL